MDSERLLQIGLPVALVTVAAVFGLHMRSYGKAAQSGGLAAHVVEDVDESPPLHLSVLCPMHATDAECPATDRSAAAASWLKDALERPSSSFCIGLVGNRGTESRPFFCACAPDAWGPNVLAAKSAFIRETRRRAGASLDTEPTSLGCVGAEDPAGHESDVAIIGPRMPPSLRHLTDALIQPRAGKAQLALHAAIVCDISASYTGERACRLETALMAYDALMATSAAVIDSTLTMYLVNAGEAPPRSLFRLTLDSAMPRSQRIAHILAARNELPAVFQAPPANDASAIAEAFPAAVNELRRRPGRYGIIILSDMREYNGSFNFEKTIPHFSQFASYLRAKGLWVDATGIAVKGCGLHDQGGAGEGKDLENLWTQALREQGVSHPNFFSACNPSDLIMSDLG